MKQRNLVGQTFGKLTVLESCGKGADRHYVSKVKCECGRVYLVPDTELLHGRRTQCRKCGASNKTHGMTSTRLFAIWQSMKQRCSDKRSQHYMDYGGRGISVCEEWTGNFEAFYDWAMANGYEDHLTIDRTDTNGNYEPSNCRWADMKAQANNKRNNRRVVYGGSEYTVAELSKKFGIKYSCLYWRLINGWNIEKAVAIQPKVGRNQYEKV